jgi:hypothetical protein
MVHRLNGFGLSQRKLHEVCISDVPHSAIIMQNKYVCNVLPQHLYCQQMNVKFSGVCRSAFHVSRRSIVKCHVATGRLSKVRVYKRGSDHRVMISLRRKGHAMLQTKLQLSFKFPFHVFNVLTVANIGLYRAGEPASSNHRKQDSMERNP